MTLGRAHPTAKGADPAKLLLLNIRPAKHTQCLGVSLGPHLTETLCKTVGLPPTILRLYTLGVTLGFSLGSRDPLG